MIANFEGYWSLKTISPLGNDYYTLFISNSIQSYIAESRGKVNFQSMFVEENSIKLIGQTDIPINANIILNGKILNKKINGNIKIDEYCNIYFSGIKNE